MATISTKLTITSTNAMTDTLNVLLSDVLTVTDPVEISKVNITTGAGSVGRNTLVPSSDSNTYYVFLKNTDSTNFVLVRRDNGSNFTEVTLVDEGTYSTNTKILVAHDVDISSQPSGTSMVYKITTHNQALSKETEVHAVSLGWK